jgi:hypothetical protein
MENPEILSTLRGNQEWTIQRYCQHEGAIKNGQSRDTVNTKGQSIMDNPEILSTVSLDCPFLIAS